MKYFIFTFYGYGLSIAYHLVKEGHEVHVGQVMDVSDTTTSVENSRNKEDELDRARRLGLYNGLLEKTPAYKLVEKMLRMKDKKDCFVFFDLNHHFKFADQLRYAGFEGNFPTEEDRLFEIDRDAAKNFVSKYYPKLTIAKVHEYQKVSEAVAFLQKNEEIWVLKGKDDNAKTFVPDSDDIDLARSQLVDNLEKFAKDYERAGFILELLIPTMVELTPEKIYYDGVPLGVTVDIENKPLGSGNLSIQTQCAADLVFPISFDEKINEIAFPPIIDEMAKRHKGLFVWDASILISKRGGRMYFGEFCSNRTGYNSFYTELAQLPSVSHFFESVVRKQNPFTLGTVAASTTIFNLQQDKTDHRILSGSVMEYKEEAEKDIWMYDASAKNGRTVAVGYDVNIAAITGSGSSVDEAVSKMYKNINKFSYVSEYYRPKWDYLSLDYTSSIPNRLNYGLEHKLFQLPFNVRLGEIKA